MEAPLDQAPSLIGAEVAHTAPWRSSAAEQVEQDTPSRRRTYPGPRPCRGMSDHATGPSPDTSATLRDRHPVIAAPTSRIAHSTPLPDPATPCQTVSLGDQPDCTLCCTLGPLSERSPRNRPDPPDSAPCELGPAGLEESSATGSARMPASADSCHVVLTACRFRRLQASRTLRVVSPCAAPCHAETELTAHQTAR